MTGRNGEIMQQQGNMFSWRRLACREAAVRPQACLMLFPLPTLVFFKIGPKQQKNWQKFLKKIMQSSIFWFCSYAYESVDSKHNEWQMRAKSGNYCRVSGEMRSLLCEVTRNARSGWLGGGTPAAGPGSDITTRHRYTGSRDIASIDITWRHPVLNRQT